MRTTLIAATLFFALFWEWTWGAKFLLFGFQAPFVIMTALFWFWKMKLFSRLWLGAALGLVWGSFSLYAPSFYIILLVVAAFVIEFWQEFFVVKSRA